jgi:hypothetical protein
MNNEIPEISAPVVGDPLPVIDVEGRQSEGGALSDYAAASMALDRTLVITLAEEVQRLQFELALEQENHKLTRILRDEKVRLLHGRIDELSDEVESAHRNLDVLSAPKAFESGSDREAMNLGGRISALGQLARDFFNRTLFAR